MAPPRGDILFPEAYPKTKHLPWVAPPRASVLPSGAHARLVLKQAISVTHAIQMRCLVCGGFCSNKKSPLGGAIQGRYPSCFHRLMLARLLVPTPSENSIQYRPSSIRLTNAVLHSLLHHTWGMWLDHLSIIVAALRAVSTLISHRGATRCKTAENTVRAVSK